MTNDCCSAVALASAEEINQLRDRVTLLTQYYLAQNEMLWLMASELGINAEIGQALSVEQLAKILLERNRT